MCTLNDFLRSTTEIAHIPEHIRAFSGRSNIGRIDDTVTGVQRFYCPPLAADKLAFTVDLNVVSHDVVISDRGSTGHGIPLQLKLQSEKWHPSYIWRKGCVHQYLGNQDTLSLGIETWVIPSAYDDAFYLKIKLQNNSTREIHMELTPNWRCCEFEKIESRLWGWGLLCQPAGKLKRQPLVSTREKVLFYLCSGLIRKP